MHGFLFCSDHPDCTLLPQAQHIAAYPARIPARWLYGTAPAAARAHRLGWVPAKPPPCIRQAPVLPCRILWLSASATRKAPDAAHRCCSRHSGIAQRMRVRFPAPALQRHQTVRPAARPSGQGCERFLQNSGWRAAPRGRRRLCAAQAVLPRMRSPSPVPAPFLPRNAAICSISCRMAANSPVNSLWLPRVSVTHRLMPGGSRPSAWIFSRTGCWGVCKIRKDNAAHCAGQLIQQAAWLAKIGILRILTDLCQLRRGQTAAIFSVPDGSHAHFKGSRTGKAAAAQHITGRVCIKAAHRFACRAETLGNAADQAGRVGALPFLRPPPRSGRSHPAC